eukprot:12547615-Ditylum_brightwellii.AAC.1
MHQCAKFTCGAKHSHEKAVLIICKYLKGIQNDRLIVCHSKDLLINCYEDADFDGLYGVEGYQDANYVESNCFLCR